jgi:hypothetical protein
MFGLVGYREIAEGEGRTPDLPEDWGFVEIACPARSEEHSWRLFALRAPPDWEVGVPATVTRVSPRLATAIYSGERWPPAMAWARLAVERWSDYDDRAGFLAMYERALETILPQQRTAPFFLARIAREEIIGSAGAGEWMWVARYNPATENVHWVSDNDWYLYSNHILDFPEIDRERLARIAEWETNWRRTQG